MHSCRVRTSLGRAGGAVGESADVVGGGQRAPHRVRGGLVQRAQGRVRVGQRGGRGHTAGGHGDPDLHHHHQPVLHWGAAHARGKVGPGVVSCLLPRTPKCHLLDHLRLAACLWLCSRFRGAVPPMGLMACRQRARDGHGGELSLLGTRTHISSDASNTILKPIDDSFGGHVREETMRG